MNLALDIEGLTFSYPAADSSVLENCSWRLPEGAFALLTGATGSGKSTLLSLCKPQISPAGARTGSIRVFGREVGEYSDEESARRIGYVFQNPETQIVCESVWHEMAFGLENLGTPQDEMRRLVAETSYFFGMEDWFHAETDTLSGGRKQLLALASVLVMQPRLLLLDEPTAMLDPIAEKNFLHALFRVNRELGCTVVVATHRPHALREYATCAFHLSDGRIEETAETGDRYQFPQVDRAEKAASSQAPQGDSADRAFVESLGARTTSAETLGKDIAEYHHLPAETGTCPQFPLVGIEGGWFRYGRGDAWVLRNLDFSVRAGSIHAVVGGNGCGKSTLLGLLAKTNRLRRGRFQRNASRTVFLPQNPKALFVAETVEDELMEWSASAGYTTTDVRAMLKTIGLLGSEGQHPYDLSGGQQQFLALGKLLLVKPDLLLLDEPTKGLDDVARSQVAALLRAASAEGKTIVMASHDLAFVNEVATTTSMMFDGEIACTQATADFFKTNVYYRP